MFLEKGRIHFVGIGGMGMSGIAKVLLELGCIVSGSDIMRSNNTKLLESLGANIYLRHRKEYVNGAKLIVTSSAIPKNNIEIKAAIKANIPIISRATMLAYLMEGKKSIAISGTHGKTSTTALVANIMVQGNMDPTVIIGGILKENGCNAFTGNSNFIVVEADESDGSLLKYSPTIAVITSIDRDHLDFYKDIKNIKRIFYNFIENVPVHGTSILCADDKIIQEFLPKIDKKILTYGLELSADLQAINIIFNKLNSQFDIIHFGKKQGKIKLNMPGVCNVYNALAATAVGLQLNIPFEIIKKSLGNGKGVIRRMEFKGKSNNIVILDDYAHHPTEIVSVLNTINKSWPKSRIIVVFQPHRYTRTHILFDEFTRSFYKSDILIILPIYSACEKPIGSLNSENLCKAIKSNGHGCVFYVDHFEECIQKLENILKKGDVLLTLGAGNVDEVGNFILNKLLDRYGSERN